jgi:hypothetical protein
MKYYIRRDLNEYGPYTLADLQRYVAQGNISPSDLTRSEGMTDWVPVGEVIGNIPALQGFGGPAAQGFVYGDAGTVYGASYGSSGSSGSSGTVYGGTGTGFAGAATGYGVAASPGTTGAVMENPPNFHWGWVLALGIITRGLFSSIWGLVQANWVRKVSNSSKALWLIVGYFMTSIAAGVMLAMGTLNRIAPEPAFSGGGLLLLLAAVVLYLCGAFSMRSDIEQYYNSVELINLHLNGAMTFFFSFIYFQYHFTRINKWKRTGVLEP